MARRSTNHDEKVGSASKRSFVGALDDDNDGKISLMSTRRLLGVNTEGNDSLDLEAIKESMCDGGKQGGCTRIEGNAEDQAGSGEFSRVEFFVR